MGNCCFKPKNARQVLSPSFMGFDLEGSNHPRALAHQTYFTEDEVYALLELFKNVSTSVVADGLIHKEEFTRAIFKASKSNKFIDRVFDLFDEEQNGVLAFGEFVRALSVFHPRCPIDKKMTFAFRIYDLFDTGSIDKDEVRVLLASILNDSNNLHVPDTVIDKIVERTFTEVDLGKSGTIVLEEFEALVEKNPSVISYMTLPVLRELTTTFPSFVFNKNA